jgi:hypothetical protein
MTTAVIEELLREIDRLKARELELLKALRDVLSVTRGTDRALVGARSILVREKFNERR